MPGKGSKKNKNNKNNTRNKNAIIGALVCVVALVIVVVVAVLSLKGYKKIDDSFFVSDGSKYVITLDGNLDVSSDSNGDTPKKAYYVYYYSGNDVTNVEAYYEFADDASAKQSYEAMVNEEGGEMKNYELNGKYIVMTVDPSEYEGMTAADAKKRAEYSDFLKSMTSDNTSNNDENGTDEGSKSESDGSVEDSSSQDKAGEDVDESK